MDGARDLAQLLQPGALAAELACPLLHRLLQSLQVAKQLRTSLLRVSQVRLQLVRIVFVRLEVLQHQLLLLLMQPCESAMDVDVAAERALMPCACSVLILRIASSAFVYLVAAKMSSNFFFSTAPSARGLRDTHQVRHRRRAGGARAPVGVVLVDEDDILEDGLQRAGSGGCAMWHVSTPRLRDPQQLRNLQVDVGAALAQPLQLQRRAE